MRENKKKFFTPNFKSTLSIAFLKTKVLAKIIEISIANKKICANITCLGGPFGMNSVSTFLKILKLRDKPKGISKFSKIATVIYPKNRPNQT